MRNLKSSRSKPEQSDAFMMPVIGLIKTSRHAFSSTGGSLSRSQDLLLDDMIIFLTSAVVQTMRVENFVVESQHLQCMRCDM